MPLILVGTKIDLKKDKSSSTKFVDKKAGEALAHDISNGRYLECSALTQVDLLLVIVAVMGVNFLIPTSFHLITIFKHNF